MPLKIFLRIYQGVILSTSMLVVSSALLIFGIIPAAQKSWTTFEAIQKISEEISFLDKKANILRQIDEGFLQNQLATLLSAVPADPAVPDLLSSLDLIAGQSGLSLTDVTINEAKTATDTATLRKIQGTVGGAMPLPFIVKGLGGVGSMRDFFAKSLTLRRLVRVTNFDITFQTGALATVKIGMDEFTAPVTKKITSSDQMLKTISADEEGVINKLNSLVSAQSGLPVAPAVFNKPDPFSR